MSDDCHPGGRTFPTAPVAREMLRAMGIIVCEHCGHAVQINGRKGARYIREAKK